MAIDLSLPFNHSFAICSVDVGVIAWVGPDVALSAVVICSEDVEEIALVELNVILSTVVVCSIVVGVTALV